MEEKVLTREEQIQSYILELLGQDPNGIEMNVLGSTVVANLNLSPAIENKEIGPCIMKLKEDGLVYGLTRVDSDSPKLIFLCEKFTPSKFAKAYCLIFGHDVPEDLAFETQLALYKGGFCRSCGKLIQVEFIGNVWTDEVSHRRELSDEDMKESQNIMIKMLESLPQGVRDKIKVENLPSQRRVQEWTELKGYDVSPAIKRGLKVMTGL